MRKLLIKELFNIYSGTPISEKEAYLNKGNIPVISSKTTDNGVIFKTDRKILEEKGMIFSTRGITWAIDGNAGKLFIQEGEYFLSNHAGALIPKKAFIDKISLEWFCFVYQNKLYDFTVANGGQGKLGTEQIANIEIILPDMKIQQSILEEKWKLENCKNTLIAIKDHLNIDKKEFTEGKKYLVKDLFLHFQGHQLTDKDIYDNIGIYPVYSGSNNEIKGFINKPLFDNEDNLPCIIYQTKGNNELKSKIITKLFNANNTAVLTMKKSKRDFINIDYINLILSKNMKLSISSQEGVSYIDTKILNTEIYLPDIHIQNEVVKKMEQIAQISLKIDDLLNQIDTQLKKEILFS